jgi:hypothetical protein
MIAVQDTGCAYPMFVALIMSVVVVGAFLAGIAAASKWK